LLLTPHAPELIPFAVGQVLFIKKSSASNPMIVGRLRVIDLRGKKATGAEKKAKASKKLGRIAFLPSVTSTFLRKSRLRLRIAGSDRKWSLVRQNDRNML
jgi:hypothetical protein